MRTNSLISAILQRVPHGILYMFLHISTLEVNVQYSCICFCISQCIHIFIYCSICLYIVPNVFICFNMFLYIFVYSAAFHLFLCVRIISILFYILTSFDIYMCIYIYIYIHMVCFVFYFHFYVFLYVSILYIFQYVSIYWHMFLYASIDSYIFQCVTTCFHIFLFGFLCGSIGFLVSYKFLYSYGFNSFCTCP